MEIDLKQLREIMRSLKQFDVTELEIEKDGERIYLRRGPESAVLAPAIAPGLVAPAALMQGAITSPFVGTFYRAPSPDARPSSRSAATSAAGRRPLHRRSDEADERDRVGGRRARSSRSSATTASPSSTARALPRPQGLRCVRRSSSRTAARSRCASSARAVSWASRPWRCTRRSTPTRCTCARRRGRVHRTGDVRLRATSTSRDHRGRRDQGADAIHPGYGFLSENAEFADICQQCGLTFIGPSPEDMKKWGDKVPRAQPRAGARAPAPAGHGRARDEHAVQKAQRIGFPVILKASAGGGGRGMKIVRTAEDLVRVFAGARRGDRGLQER
jgi:hypothetical protein